MAVSVLIVEDDRNIAELLQMYLEKEGYAVTVAADGGQGLAKFRAIKPDLVLLDVMMPVMDGWAVCRAIRAESQTPVIMLTAKGEEIDRILGLELGADDYIVKPFSPREVVARIKAVLRRTSEQQSNDDGRVTLNGLVIDIKSYTVTLKGQPVICTPKEIEILYMLASNPGQVFTREQLLNKVWGYDFAGETRTVDTHIKRIRAKLDNTGLNWSIKTIYGVGYKFEVE